ncbi:Sulfate transporter, putative [Perkinsus marinus ATCC 50983]|uniref:Sulfate transporter, putative n=1 Tax=Perkinsus marinus (strain ATCC 50983 / TXsc) TaxID=423536 RepID=C5LKD3_PERM5|nr:Sulfate transporter, putative [Perkinsus marinus ATCC 50983]EER02815.1 Sulfate transporter, putative [Perkinsus marinus ATCC 50983]|eukprot:XP_002770999.1 Sulfate transporter, putative [Perkinsus marinus ATCC 50983]
MRDFIKNWIPLVGVLTRYTRLDAEMDVRGGITLGLITISQSIAHANIAHVGLINGPYSCVWPVLIYAIFGTSPHMSVGTGAMMALMTGEHVAHIPDLATRTAVGCQLALVTGIAMCILALLRLSSLVRFISRPALSGFVTGAAFVIVASLMKDFFGLHHLPKGVDFFENMYLVGLRLNEASPAVTALSLLTVGIIWIFARYRTHFRRIQFIAGYKELVAGDETVGLVPPGLPSLALPPLSGIPAVLPDGIMVAFMCFISSYAAAKKFAIVDGYEIHAGTELGVMGVANLVGSVFGAFPVQGGLSRTCISHSIGVRTQVAGIVAALIAIGGLTFLTSLMYWIPNAALAGIIISATPHLTDFHFARWLWHNSKRDFAVWLVAVGGTLLMGLLQGVFLSMVLSVTLMVQQIAMPPTNAMGRLSNGHWRALAYWPTTAKTIPGLLVFGVDGPLLFVNWDHVKDKLLHTEQRYSRHCRKSVQAVVMQMVAVPFIDATAIQGLEELAVELQGRGVTLWFAGAHGSVRRMLETILVERHIIDQTDLVQQVEAVVQQALRHIDLPVTTQAAVIIQRWWRNRRQSLLYDGEYSDVDQYAKVSWAVDDSTLEEMYRNQSVRLIPSSSDLFHEYHQMGNSKSGRSHSAE